MYPKKNYYPHKIIYLVILFFKDPNILLLTLLFVYTLPCFHPNPLTFTLKGRLFTIAPTLFMQYEVDSELNKHFF